MATPVERIKEKLSITDVVGSYVKLEKSGLYYKACCPFHNEKTASFFVSPSRNSFHCFGCAKGGDIFTFVQEIEGLEFPEALKILADRANVSLSEYEGNKAELAKNKRLYSLLADTTIFFTTTLTQMSDVKDYLHLRGLTDETIDIFQIGFAPASGNKLMAHLKSAGYTEAEMKSAGVVAVSDRGPYDRFRSRIMFPIRDTQGRVVAFSGRIYGEQANEPNVAKYVNSPEGVLYSKSKILFGYDMAKQAILRDDFCLVVEGQFDLVMAHQAGNKNTVAVSGTALTEAHVALLHRFTNNIVLSFDADKAGLSAAKRSITLALSLGFDVAMLRIPSGKDPAEAIKESVNEWHDAIKNRMHVIDFFLDNALSSGLSKRDLTKKVREDVLLYVSQVKSPLDRGQFIAKIASVLGLAESYVQEELASLVRESMQEEKNEYRKESPPEIIATARDQTEERLFGYLLLAESKRPDSPFFQKTKEEYDRITGTSFDTLHKALEPAEQERMLFISEMMFGIDDEKQSEINELLGILENKKLTRELEQSLVDLRRAETAKDTEAMNTLMQSISTISKKIQDIKNNQFT